MLKRLFGFDPSISTPKREVVAGVTTFLTMAYILAVNPMILATTGLDYGALFTATALSSAVATLMMALYAKLPLAQAPAMGINAFFAYTLVGAMGYSPQTALAVVFIEGILFILLTMCGVREKIVDAIPETLKQAIPIGIGFFIAFVGLSNGGVIVGHEATLVALGEFSPTMIIACVGVVLCAILCHLRVKGGLFISIMICTIASIILGINPLPQGFSLISMPAPIAPTFLQFDFTQCLHIDIILIIVILTFMDIFNTLGTLIGAASQANLIDEKGEILHLKESLMCDAVGTTVGAVLGTSTVTTYVESSAGIAEGGRSGLTSFTVAVLFLCALFFAPLFALIPAYATTGALVMVGVFMCRDIGKINFGDMSEATPAFLTIITTLLTYSIPEGITMGIVSYTIINLCAKETQKLTFVHYTLTILLLLRYAYWAITSSVS